METSVTENEMVELVDFGLVSDSNIVYPALRHEVALGEKFIEIGSSVLIKYHYSSLLRALCCRR